MIDNTIIVVNDEPYCVWEAQLHERNAQFLSGIDAEYYEYLFKLYMGSEDEERASIALRSAFHHAQETFFSLIGALLQAPNAAYAWIAKCTNRDLRTIVYRICHEDESLYTRFTFKDNYVSWLAISKIVCNWYLPGSEKQKSTIELFAQLWLWLAQEFLDEHNINEYKSIKHGFRIRPGGFTMAFGLEHEYGVAPPPSEMQFLGGSKYGASFFVVNPVGNAKGNRNITSRRYCINWKIEKMGTLLQLLASSIQNVTNALKILDGTPAGECKFTRPSEDQDFTAPWEHEPEIPWSNFDFVIDEQSIPHTTRSELIKKLKQQRK